MAQESLSRRLLKAGLVLVVLVVLAGSGFLAYQQVVQVIRITRLSNSQEILNYYASAQDRYRSTRGRYGTIRELLDSKALYLGAQGDIPWAEEMSRHGYQFHFSVSADMRSFAGKAKPTGRVTKGLKELSVSSPN